LIGGFKMYTGLIRQYKQIYYCWSITQENVAL